MNIVRYAGPDGVRVGVGDGAAVRPLAVASVAELLAMRPAGCGRWWIRLAIPLGSCPGCCRRSTG